MANDRFEMEGVVVQALKGAKFKVKLDNTDIECLCTLSGKLRQNYIRIIEGDHVTIDISPDDPTKGRIIWRDK